MIRIETVKLEYLNYIENIANSSSEYLVPNNHMIYYLCCTVFSKYSFIAFKNDVNDSAIPFNGLYENSTNLFGFNLAFNF